MEKKNRLRIIALVCAVIAAAAAVLCFALSEQNKNEPSPALIAKEVENLVINKDITAPYGVSVVNTSDEGIKIYWKEPENVQGYVIYRSYSKDGDFSVLDTVGNTPYFSTYTDSNYDTSVKRVYYLVRAIRETEEGKTYSELSELITAKYKESIKLSKSKIFMFSNTVRKVSAYYGWTNAHGVKWTSEDESIAKVNQNGEITGVSKGETNIICSSDETGLSAKVKITVDREDDKMLSESIEHRYGLTDDIYTNPKAEKTDEAVIMMVGDLMALAPHMKACRTEAGIYDFRPCYEYVKPVFEQSDLNIGNLETMVASEFSYGNEESSVDGWPNANTSATLLDALMYAGIDALPMSNNHNADCGVEGVHSTLDTIDRYGFPHTGVFNGKDEKRYIIFDVNGIKVGITAYTTEECGFNTKEEAWDENDVDVLLNYYSEEKAKQDILDMKNDGAEYCIAYMHWGIKNYFEPTDDQFKTAQELADMGYDYIAGSHPHTIQKYADISASDGRKVPCIFSMGDFSSHINQIEGNRDTLIMRIKIKRDKNGKIVTLENNYIPVYIYTEYNGKPFVSMPLQPEFNGGQTELKHKDKYLSRIKNEAGEDISIFSVK